MADKPEEKIVVPGVATFQFRGTDYTIPAVVQKDKEDLHAYANAYGLRSVRAMVKFQTAEENALDYDAAMRRVLAGTLSWENQDGRAFRYGLEGWTYLCWLCLKHRHPTLPLSDVRLMVLEPHLSEAYDLANLNPTVPPSSETGG